MKTKKFQLRVDLWSIFFGVALSVFGYLLYDRVMYLQGSVVVDGKVIGKELSSKRVYDVSRKKNVDEVSLEFGYSYIDPDGTLTSGVGQAAILWNFYSKGDPLKLYLNPTARQREAIANPFQFYLFVFMSLCVVIFILPFYRMHLRGNYIDFREVAPSLFLPVLVVLGFIFFEFQGSLATNDRLVIEKQKEKSWPRWNEFESAIPKPYWWDKVDLAGFDPMTATYDDFRSFSDQYNMEFSSNASQLQKRMYYYRSFKVAYAKFLRFRNEPDQIVTNMSLGANKVMLPLYDFFTDYYWQGDWELAPSRKCHGGPLVCTVDHLLMSNAFNQLYTYRASSSEKSDPLINRILKDRYDRVDPYYQVRFLYEVAARMRKGAKLDFTRKQFEAEVVRLREHFVNKGLKGTHQELRRAERSFNGDIPC